MPLLETFLECVWSMLWRGDGILGHWPNEDYDMELVRDKELGILLSVSNEEVTRRFRVKLEEVK